MGRNDLWFPMYWKDYLADTRHLDQRKHGAYLLLMGTYYVTRKPLPLEENQLVLICLANTEPEVEAMRFVLSAFFNKEIDGWHHGRVDQEIAKTLRLREIRSEIGKKGGRPKNQLDNQKVSTQEPIGEPNRNHTHTHTPRSKASEPSQEPIGLVLESSPEPPTPTPSKCAETVIELLAIPNTAQAKTLMRAAILAESQFTGEKSYAEVAKSLVAYAQRDQEEGIPIDGFYWRDTKWRNHGRKRASATAERTHNIKTNILDGIRQNARRRDEPNGAEFEVGTGKRVSS